MTTASRLAPRALVAVSSPALVLVAAASGSAAWGDGPASPGDAARARGLVYTGLARASDGPCAGGFEIRGPGLGRLCSHGPDPAPAGVDVTAGDAVASGGTAVDSVPIPCIGDGTSGPRVQVVYAVAADRTDRFSTVAPQIVTWAGQMENAVEKSALQGGGQRYLRFVTTPGCALDVAKASLTAAGDDTFGAMIAELKAQGFSRTDRRYIVWADATVYCGIGQVVGNDSPDASNPANTGPAYGRVDTGCWNRADHSSPLHELFHTLGAVQPSAPHSTALYHCTDESDALCYSDAAGVTTTQACPAENEWLLDCGNDDYFAVSPSPGSYLATHWNTASSVFLAASLTAADPPSGGGTTPATTTDTFTGSLTSKKPSVAFSVPTGSGAAAGRLTFSASGRSKTAVQLTLKVLRKDGTVVASGSGASGLTLSPTLSAGTYSWVVSGSTSASFTLAVTHVAP
ncbi:MAG: hypothetical protein LCI03_18160 [Actinobacteria bacterium]|nr:hypothetical protein [Actinomycetota bacterium]